MAEFENLPILFAYDETGVLRHVDEVKNGLACGCRCPDPNCGQELVAKNAGTKRIHHFAHMRGTCEWSIENVLMGLALEAVSSSGRVAFPRLAYHDAMTGRNDELSPARTLRVSAPPSLESISGRGAPELVVTCAGGSVEKRFALVISLIHKLKDAELEKLASAGIDVVLINLRESYKVRIRQEGKHYDRAAIVASYQDRHFIESLMLDEDCSIKTWAVNKRRLQKEEESAERKRAWDAEQAEIKAECERKRQAQERANAERRAAAMAEQARKSAIRAGEEAERRAAEQSAYEMSSCRGGEQEHPVESKAVAQCQSRAIASEAAACERNGNVARKFIKKGVRDFVPDCPLHGEASVVMQCGAYSYSSSRCPHFVRMRRCVIECSLVG